MSFFAPKTKFRPSPAGRPCGLVDIVGTRQVGVLRGWRRNWQMVQGPGSALFLPSREINVQPVNNIRDVAHKDWGTQIHTRPRGRPAGYWGMHSYTRVSARRYPHLGGSVIDSEDVYFSVCHNSHRSLKDKRMRKRNDWRMR